jgi:ATP-binding cassette subfamily C (CFTR/MRP) protein 2
MNNFWSMICGDNEEKSLCYDLKLLKDPSSCINHVLVIFFDVIVLTMLLFIMILKSSLRPYWSQVRYSNMQLVSAITNGFLGILHLSLGVWFLEEILRKNHKAFPLHWCC